MRSLILRGGALGDFLVTLPLLEALELRFPGGHVELIGNKTAAALGVEAKLLAAAHDQNDARWMPLFGGAPLPPELSEWLLSFDLVASFFPDPDGALKQTLSRARAGRVLVCGTPHPKEVHAALHFLLPFAGLGIGLPSFVTPLRAFGGVRSGIAIHPGSGSLAKNWPRGRWDRVSEDLARSEAVHTILGPAETGGALSGSVDTWTNLPLSVLADRLSRCRLYLGNDSGISHLAAACGVPCVLLFGPSDASVWAPRSPGVFVLPNAAEVSPERVLDEAHRSLRAAG